jgi:signal transduction histidine kinase
MISTQVAHSSNALAPEQFQRLLEISARLSSTLDLQRLLAQVLDIVVELTNTSAASILLVDSRTGELRFVAATGETTLQSIVVPKDSIAGWIVANGKTFISNNVQADAHFFTGVDDTLQHRTRNLLGVPLITKDRTVGALEVLNKIGDLDYTGQDVALLQALAGQAAIAIENAQLFQQSDLVAEIMHELKTPLMAITSASELALRSELPAETQTELLQLIQKESLRMSNMTKDFLDLAQLESGRLHMLEEEVDLKKIVPEVVNLVDAQARKRHIKIYTHFPSHMPTFKGDSNRIQQVLLNLISNAIKYNIEQGEIDVHLQTKPDTLLLSVQDTGVGLSSVDMEHLFTRFYRVEKQAHQTEGSGLGLSIAKKIIEEHGGSIEVSSELGQGSTFTCIFPIKRPA